MDLPDTEADEQEVQQEQQGATEALQQQNNSGAQEKQRMPPKNAPNEFDHANGNGRRRSTTAARRF